MMSKTITVDELKKQFDKESNNTVKTDDNNMQVSAQETHNINESSEQPPSPSKMKGPYGKNESTTVVSYNRPKNMLKIGLLLTGVILLQYFSNTTYFQNLLAKYIPNKKIASTVRFVGFIVIVLSIFYFATRG